MCGLAVAVLRISPKEFWESTPIEIYSALEYSAKIRENETKEKYEIMRLHAYLVLIPNISEDSNVKSSKDLIKFKWEEDEKKVELKEPDWDELDRRLKNMRG